MNPHARLGRTALLMAAAGASLHASDWSAWRGSDATAVSPDRGFPIHWSRTEHVAWTVDLPGKGASSPIIADGRIYLTSQTEDHGLYALAFDAKSGQLLWDQEIAMGNAKAHSLHNMATPTAVDDRKHEWVMFGTGDVAALDLKGTVLWHRAFGTEFGPYKANHGYGSSPLLLNGCLYVTMMHQGPSFLLCLDPASGKTVWKTLRNLAALEEANDSYSSPLAVAEKGKISVVLSGAESIDAYDSASGRQRWIYNGVKLDHPYGRTIAGATAADGIVVAVASGLQNRGYLLAVRAGGVGEVTETHKLWTAHKFARDCPTPVLDQGRVFSIRDDGMAACSDLKPGGKFGKSADLPKTRMCRRSPPKGGFTLTAARPIVWW